MRSRYEQPVLTQSQASVTRLVRAGSDVLELGANTGYITRAIKDKGCRVTGIEYDRVALTSLETTADFAYWGDLNDLSTLAHLSGKSYDTVILADVLEHLTNPVQALSWAAERLTVDGSIIVSMPNFAHWSVRREIARGRFRMTDTGILDRTHLKFYTLSTAVSDLFSPAGVRVVASECTHEGWPLSHRFDRLPRLRDYIGNAFMRLRPAMFGYQGIWILVRN